MPRMHVRATLRAHPVSATAQSSNRSSNGLFKQQGLSAACADQARPNKLVWWCVHLPSRLCHVCPAGRSTSCSDVDIVESQLERARDSTPTVAVRCHIIHSSQIFVLSSLTPPRIVCVVSPTRKVSLHLPGVPAPFQRFVAHPLKARPWEDSRLRIRDCCAGRSGRPPEKPVLEARLGSIVVREGKSPPHPGV